MGTIPGAQGGINGLIGDMADGLSGGATNAVVGLLNGTQNLETASPISRDYHSRKSRWELSLRWALNTSNK
ncbi:hypothetical protein ACLB1N_34270 [Escherichia coli]